MAARVLSPERVRVFYDRFGARQDAQAFYEDGALERLVALGEFDKAGRVFELGCGTGRFVRRLLEAPSAGSESRATACLLRSRSPADWKGRAGPDIESPPA